MRKSKSAPLWGGVGKTQHSIPARGNKITGQDTRELGLDSIIEAPWGTHLCQFYDDPEDLLDILVPYFKAGLENNEVCMWVTSDSLPVDLAQAALTKEVNNLEEYVKKGQIEILDASQWHTKSGKLDADKVFQGWVKKEEQAIKNGFDGLRLTGNTFWPEKRDWRTFADYEAMLDNVIGQHRMIVICSYSLDRCDSTEIIDVVHSHQRGLVRRQGRWTVTESAERKRAEEELWRLKELNDRIIATTGSGLVVLTSDLEIAFANPEFHKMSGLKQGTLEGKLLLQIPELKSLARFASTALSSSELSVARELVYHHPEEG